MSQSPFHLVAAPLVKKIGDQVSGNGEKLTGAMFHHLIIGHL
jgi:hypothetical protein